MFRKNKLVSLAEVKQSLDQEKMLSQPLTRRMIFQPLADILTVFFNNTGWTANSVTLLRGALTIISLTLVPFAIEPFQLQCILIVVLLTIVLDYVDGNLSRLHDSASYFGKYLDGYFDFLIPTFLLPAIGWLLSKQSENHLFFQIALSYSLLCCFLWFTRERVRSFIHYMRIELLKKEKNIREFNSKEIRKEHAYASLMQSTRNLAYCLLLVPDLGYSYFIFNIIYLSLCLPPWFYLHFRLASVYLDSHKFSALARRK